MGKNLHKGYYGQYSGNSKFSKRHDEDYDAKEAYNKNLTASARLHYLENLRHDHDSPASRMGEMKDHGMGYKGWEAHKKTMHGIRDHGGPNLVDPREDKESYEYDYDFAADRQAEKDAKKAAKDAATKMSALHVEGGKAAHAASMRGSIQRYQEHIKTQQHHTDPSAPRSEQDPTNPNHPHYRKPKKGQQNP